MLLLFICRLIDYPSDRKPNIPQKASLSISSFFYFEKPQAIQGNQQGCSHVCENGNP